MTLRTPSRKSGFVPHPFRVRAEGNQEEVDLAQPRMAQPVDALRERPVQSPPKDEGELLADLTLGTRSAHLAAFSRLDQVQREGGSIVSYDVEALPHVIDEVVAREPLEVCHQAMVSASTRTSRTGT